MSQPRALKFSGKRARKEKRRSTGEYRRGPGVECRCETAAATTVEHEEEGEEGGGGGRAPGGGGQGGGWVEGTERNGTERHPQFRDCFSDDTLYTHGQHQPTHYGNDTCASIRINILMDVREGREGKGRGVGGESGSARERAVRAQEAHTDLFETW